MVLGVGHDAGQGSGCWQEHPARDGAGRAGGRGAGMTGENTRACGSSDSDAESGCTPRLVLASRSPRRRELLERHGYDFDVVESGFDDGGLTPGQVNPEAWVMSLALLKASAAAEMEDPGNPRGIVLGADTICIKDGELIGQPIDEADAARIIRSFRNTTHEVVTGVAFVCLARRRRVAFCDRSVVTVGDITDEQIAEYVESGAWRGKAGAYNLGERIEAGWDIRFEGDASSIMGLPMAALRERLERFCAA